MPAGCPPTSASPNAAPDQAECQLCTLTYTSVACRVCRAGVQHGEFSIDFGFDHPSLDVRSTLRAMAALSHSWDSANPGRKTEPLGAGSEDPGWQAGSVRNLEGH